jgi:hypothetical protein
MEGKWETMGERNNLENQKEVEKDVVDVVWWPKEERKN